MKTQAVVGATSDYDDQLRFHAQMIRGVLIVDRWGSFIDHRFRPVSDWPLALALLHHGSFET